MSFPFEKLVVYQKALQFVKEATDLSQNLKGKVPYSILDQFLRASLSIPLNIAEGNGRRHTKDKIHFFLIARGSLFETVPLVQLLAAMGHLENRKYKQWYADLEDISKMTAGVLKMLDNSGGK